MCRDIVLNFCNLAIILPKGVFMKKINPFYEEKYIPVEDTYKNWQELCSEP